MGSKKDDKKKLKLKRTAVSNLAGIGGGKGGGAHPKPKSGGAGKSGGGHNISEKVTQASETLEHTFNISVATVQLGNSTSGGGGQ